MSNWAVKTIRDRESWPALKFLFVAGLGICSLVGGCVTENWAFVIAAGASTVALIACGLRLS